jgi:hypothetical protein
MRIIDDDLVLTVAMGRFRTQARFQDTTALPSTAEFPDPSFCYEGGCNTVLARFRDKNGTAAKLRSPFRAAE